MAKARILTRVCYGLEMGLGGFRHIRNGVHKRASSEKFEGSRLCEKCGLYILECSGCNGRGYKVEFVTRESYDCPDCKGKGYAKG